MSNSNDPICPPTDGTVLLPDTLAFHDRHNADIPMYMFSEDGVNEVSEVSYCQFGRACRRVPQALDVNFASSTKPVVALIAFADTLLYQTIIVGMMTAGLVPFPISPRNTAAAVANLLRKTSCHYVFATCTTLKDLLDNVEVELRKTHPNHSLTIKEIPTLSQIFPEFSEDPTADSGGFDPVAPASSDYANRRKSKLDDVALYLHSSGSTGLPKAIPKTHRDILEYVESPCCTIFLRRSQRVRMPGMQLPPFHALGIVVQVFLPLFSCLAIVFYPPVVKSAEIVPILPAPDTILDHLKRTNCNALVIIPSFLQVWAQEKESIDILRRLELVTYSGGALSTKLGNFLVENGVNLQSVYGGTEVGGPACSSRRRGDEREWEYVEFSDKWDIRWIPQGNGTYECQFLSTGAYHLSVVNLPDGHGFATSDLFKRHPTKDHLWKIVGRLDDLIIHSSGEKTVPPPMEDIVMSSPLVMGVVMFGQGHDQPGVLIEPSSSHQIDVDDVDAVAQIRNLIWPVIDEANKIAPGYSKIFKEMILITDKRKPLPRAAKGTVIRKLSLSIYADEIEAIYASIESAVEATQTTKPPAEWDRAGVTQWILDQVHDMCPGRTILVSKNLFEQGLDSLSATILRRRITGALQSIKTDASPGATAAAQAITQNTIYNHPTVDTLSAHLLELLTDPHATGDSISQSRAESIEEMIRKYSFSPNVIHSDGMKGRDTIVLLTGSTGHLGSQVLDGLLRDSRISKVYTLNRRSVDAGSMAERHLTRFRDKGLDEVLLRSPKLIHLESDYSAKNLGLSESVYSELSAAVNAIIHVAWRLDFNLTLASFESNVRGTYNLIELARSGVHASNVKFIFTSSVATAQSWDQTAGPYPEDVVLDAKYAVGSGYGESKYVTERILATSGLNTTSLRIGQISGTLKTGAWATTDWVPILIKSSLALGSLPTANGSVSWIPMDVVSNCILDLVFYAERYPPALNVLHPSSVEWNSIMNYINEALGRERNVTLPLIPFSKWYVALKECCTAYSADVRKIPAIKLHDFFEQLSNGDLAISSQNAQAFGTARFAIAKMQAISETLAGLPPLTHEDADKWVKYWSHTGFFD
ncbi:hypothetical protein BDZ97DRAFT_1349060 [Flammula alnicola]|nr:hypothetical protein BDZ97DRAFT_1349060 [Flammula alnicola]